MDSDSIGTWLAIVTPVIFIGVYGFTSIKKGKSDVIRQDNADLRASNQDKVTQIAGLEATVKQQEIQIKNLQEVATQTPEVKQLIELTSKQQRITNQQHIDVIKQLSDLATQLANLTTEFSLVAKAMSKNTSAQDANTATRVKE